MFGIHCSGGSTVIPVKTHLRFVFPMVNVVEKLLCERDRGRETLADFAGAVPSSVTLVTESLPQLEECIHE